MLGGVPSIPVSIGGAVPHPIPTPIPMPVSVDGGFAGVPVPHAPVAPGAVGYIAPGSVPPGSVGGGVPGVPGAPGTGAVIPGAPATGGVPAPGSVPPGSPGQSLASYLKAPNPGGFTAARGMHANGMSTDEANLSAVAGHLMSALSASNDPNLRSSLSTALAALSKHMAGLHKERQDALAGKLSPRLLEEAHNQAAPAHLLAQQGNYAQAAQQWISRHPYAVAHNHIPAFVSQWLSQPNPATHAAAYTNAPAGTNVAQ